MKKIFSIIFIILGFLIFSVLIVILIYEVFPQKMSTYCQTFSKKPKGLTCQDLKIKYGPLNQEIPALLFEIQAGRQMREFIPEKKYMILADNLIYEVERKDIFGNNGLTCGYFAYISKDLPSEAKRFVKRHELAHILGTGDEVECNKEAGGAYPIGFLETIIVSSLRTLFNPESPFGCKIIYLWKTFKEYFILSKESQLPQHPF